MPGTTLRLIHAMTDPGLFERLATAVVRASDPRFASLSHTGVNVEGKTIRAPLDAVGFVPGKRPPHVVFVHHTVCGPGQLHGKWLHDPAGVKARKPSGPTQPAGDIVKTLAILARARMTSPNLGATLVLTTTREPSLDILRDTHALLEPHDVTIDVWPGSRIAQFLDTRPDGQYIRRQYLGIAEEALSIELLRELSAESLSLRPPQGDPGLWVARELDDRLSAPFQSHAVFVVAESGLGKSVACFKRLKAHIGAGGCGLILPHEAVENAFSVDSALEVVLRQLRPSLAAGCGAAARSLGSPDKPLLLLVEDINRSGAGHALLEKLNTWGAPQQAQAGGPSWVLLCPVWPRLVAALGVEARKRVGHMALSTGVFSASEGKRAVELNHRLAGLATTELEATAIAGSLGHDPLLIALHEPADRAAPGGVLSKFVEDSLTRVSDATITPGEAGDALHALALGMLRRRVMQPNWRALTVWPEITANQQTALRKLATTRELFALTGPSSCEEITFRHDRVRDRILANALARLFRQGELNEDLVGEPYYAEIVGIAAADCVLTHEEVDQIKLLNPLALFFTLRAFGEPSEETHREVVRAIARWLSEEATHGMQHAHCRWHALLALYEVRSSLVLAIARRFRGRSWPLHRVLCREGDLNGAINTCLVAEPGIGMAGLEGLFQHVRKAHGASLAASLQAVLLQPGLAPAAIRGSLYLAGYLADPGLASAIAACWSHDPVRQHRLDAYLWAGAQCSGADPELILGPVCDAWAALPEKTEAGASSARYDLAAHNVRWAFRKGGLPTPVLHYFIERAKQSELRWPIFYMLDGVDDPEAVAFIVQQRAEQSRRGRMFISSHFDDERNWAEERGRTMSLPSKAQLLELWMNQSDVHLSMEAFKLWSASRKSEDLHTLQAVEPEDALYVNALWQRLRWGDVGAVPGMLERLKEPHNFHWWQMGHYVWSGELTVALDDALRARGAGSERDIDWILAELLQARPTLEAEALLVRNWEHLKARRLYILAAIYVATPTTRRLAAEAVETHPDKSKLFEHVLTRFGHRTQDRSGIYRLEQLEAIRPYLAMLEEDDISQLREVCREKGWTAFKSSYLDTISQPTGRDAAYHDQDALFRELDEMSQKQPQSWIDHWLDRFLETGASRDTVLTRIGGWLKVRRTRRDLQLAASAVLHCGRRTHLTILNDVAADLSGDAAEIVADTRFGLMRRSLT